MLEEEYKWWNREWWVTFPDTSHRGEYRYDVWMLHYLIQHPTITTKAQKTHPHHTSTDHSIKLYDNNICCVHTTNCERGKLLHTSPLTSLPTVEWQRDVYNDSWRTVVIMRLLTHNVLNNNSPSAKGNGYPLRLIQVTSIRVENTINNVSDEGNQRTNHDEENDASTEGKIEFVKGIIPTLHWPALVQVRRLDVSLQWWQWLYAIPDTYWFSFNFNRHPPQLVYRPYRTCYKKIWLRIRPFFWRCIIYY